MTCKKHEKERIPSEQNIAHAYGVSPLSRSFRSPNPLFSRFLCRALRSRCLRFDAAVAKSGQPSAPRSSHRPAPQVARILFASSWHAAPPHQNLTRPVREDAALVGVKGNGGVGHGSILQLLVESYSLHWKEEALHPAGPQSPEVKDPSHQRSAMVRQRQ
jgi:hypothetical protein